MQKKVKIQNVICVLIIFIISYSCNNDKAKREKFQLESFKIDPGLAQKLSIGNIYIDEEKIPLATADTCLVDIISQLHVTNNRFYLLTDNQRVFSFSKQGDLIYLIDKQGKGPAEYVYPMCLYVNPDDQFLEIYNRGSKNVVVIDKKGNYISDWNYDLYITKATHYKNMTCMLVGSEINYIDGKECNMQLYVYDSLHNLYSSYIPFNKEFWKFLGVGGRIDMVHIDDNLHVRVMFNDTVYCLSKKDNKLKLQPKYLFDFGKYSIPEHLFHKGFADCSEFGYAMDKYDCIQNLFRYTETDEHIYFAFEMNRTLYHFFYSKRKKQAKIIDKLIIPFNGFIYERELQYYDIPNLTHGNYFYFVVESDDYIKEMERIRKYLGENKWKDFQKNNKEYCDFVKALNFMDNPIVVKRKINHALFN
ncbi:MAG: 6-bladed beta-propeller [Bacteroidales bacterium]